MSDVTFKPGDSVIVAHPVSAMERGLLGVTFTVKRLALTPSLRVVCKDDWGSWHIHPEALEHVS